MYENESTLDQSLQYVITNFSDTDGVQYVINIKNGRSWSQISGDNGDIANMVFGVSKRKSCWKSDLDVYEKVTTSAVRETCDNCNIHAVFKDKYFKNAKIDLTGSMIQITLDGKVLVEQNWNASCHSTQDPSQLRQLQLTSEQIPDGQHTLGIVVAQGMMMKTISISYSGVYDASPQPSVEKLEHAYITVNKSKYIDTQNAIRATVVT